MCKHIDKSVTKAHFSHARMYNPALRFVCGCAAQGRSGSTDTAQCWLTPCAPTPRSAQVLHRDIPTTIRGGATIDTSRAAPCSVIYMFCSN